MSSCLLGAHPEFGKTVDGSDWELGEEVVEQTEGAESIRHTDESVVCYFLHDVPLQVQSRQ